MPSVTVWWVCFQPRLDGGGMIAGSGGNSRGRLLYPLLEGQCSSVALPSLTPADLPDGQHGTHSQWGVVYHFKGSP